MNKQEDIITNAVAYRKGRFEGRAEREKEILEIIRMYFTGRITEANWQRYADELEKQIKEEKV